MQNPIRPLGLRKPLVRSQHDLAEFSLGLSRITVGHQLALHEIGPRNPEPERSRVVWRPEPISDLNNGTVRACDFPARYTKHDTKTQHDYNPVPCKAIHHLVSQTSKKRELQCGGIFSPHLSATTASGSPILVNQVCKHQWRGYTQLLLKLQDHTITPWYPIHPPH
jgi:hypothetical protein